MSGEIARNQDRHHFFAYDTQRASHRITKRPQRCEARVHRARRERTVRHDTRREIRVRSDQSAQVAAEAAGILERGSRIS